VTFQSRAERTWLELVADLMSGVVTDIPDERIAITMCETFGLSGCAYNDLAPAGPLRLNLWPGDAGMGGLRDELIEWTMSRAAQEHPLLRFHLLTGRRVPMQILDVPHSIAGPRIRGGWSDIGRAVGATHQLSLPLQFGPRHHRAFVLGRPDVFGRQDMQLAHLLWGLLTGVDRHLATLVRVRPELDVAADLRLTPRQLSVLGLLAEGHTAAGIARRLTIAERTVRKHLEHLYAKLGVTDRLAAVLRARDTGLLPRR
jgi:DNA-binding CsgD family transcriptional regulator